MTTTLHFDHPWRIAAGAVGALAVSGLVAMQSPLPQWELDLTLWINGAPDWVASVLYPVMQLGTIIAPLLLAVVMVVWKRDLWTAGAAVIGGVVTWFAAKGVKQMVERGRPLQYLPEIDVREGTGTGLGFISGHSAVAACTALIAMTVVPRRLRPVLVLLAFLVGVGRIVHGVHLPADVVGGWGFGVLVGLATIELMGRLRARLASPERSAA
jgi:membrane-associated phospholipid phosphatase